MTTYEFTSGPLVLDGDSGLAVLLLDIEWPVLDVPLDVILVHLTTDKSLGVENGVFRIRVECVFGAVSNTAKEAVSSENLLFSL